MDDEQLVFNGVDGASGGYLLPPMTATATSRLVRGKPPDADLPLSERDQLRSELAWRKQRDTEEHFAPEEGIDPKDLAQAGWGIVFAADVDPAPLREALAELLDHRRAQAGFLYRDLGRGDGYRPDETKNRFLARHGAGPGPVKPTVMPYYLLLVGSPQEIPYRFQYQLDVQHAVGRIHFATLDEYANYARSVVTAERGPGRPRRATFVGVRNPGDRATALSAADLVEPLAAHVAADQPGWTVQTLLAEEATKARVLPLLAGTGAERPALLFTASHGVGFPIGHPRQLPHQGALICQDWPGPSAARGELPEDWYLSADDLGDDARLLGLLAFYFACYGAGTPRLDDFSDPLRGEREAIAPHAFVARLPQRLLGHPKGGALAVVGHVDRAWGCSFRWNTVRNLAAFESMVKRLMEGYPVGSAMEPFNGRYAELASDLTQSLEDARWVDEAAIDHLAIAGMWTSHNDARAYALVGDPAVRLVLAEPADGAAGGEAATIEPVRLALGADAGPAIEAQPVPVPPGAAAPAAAAPTAAEPYDDRAVTGEAGGDAGTPVTGAGVAAVTAAPAVIAADADDNVPRPAGPTGGGAGGEVDFGVRDTAAELAGALGELVVGVARAVQAAVADAASLRVVTYTSADLEAATYDKEKGRFGGNARLRAVTRLTIDGDTLLLLPEEDGAVDDAVWAVHAEAVARAQAYRTELLKAALSAATGLLGPSKVP